MEPSPDNLTTTAPARQVLLEDYPALWKKVIREWKSDREGDRMWLVYAANYLFQTAGIRWAMGPISLYGRLGQADARNLAEDLEGLSFVLLTHRHKDHLDFDLISALRHLPIRWVIPGFLQFEVIRRTGLERARIITPEIFRPITLDGIRVTPIPGAHWEQESGGTLRGVPAMGYAVEFKRKTWLFPGDTRAYREINIPLPKEIAGMVAHVWLGRGSARLENPPLLDEFCRFCLSFHPARIMLAHLEEVGREPEEMWDERHADLVRARLNRLAPQTGVGTARTGDGVDL